MDYRNALWGEEPPTEFDTEVDEPRQTSILVEGRRVMTQYHIRALSPGRWEMSRWEDKDTPKVVYYLYQGRPNISCDCPSPQIPCKHVGILKAWLTIPLPHRELFLWNADTNTFDVHPFLPID